MAFILLNFFLIDMRTLLVPGELYVCIKSAVINRLLLLLHENWR